MARHGMQVYGMAKFEMLTEIRERCLAIQDNKKKRPQDAASASDEQPAKRACLASPPPAAQQDDECVFVKVSTLAERDAIGRANTIVLD